MGVCAVRKWQLKAATLTVAVALLLASPAMALEKLVGGIAGQNSPTTWPYSIAMAKGMLAKRGMEFDIVYGQSASSILQQLVGGSVDLVVSTGINEPMHAAAKGAAVGILRIVGKVPPYAIDAQKNIHSLKELKGKTIAIGGRTDITRLYYDRMLEPDARVARCLAALFNPYLNPGIGLNLQISQEEVGNLSGTSRQRANQALQVLEKAGLLKVDYGSITINDLEGLRQFPG